MNIYVSIDKVEIKQQNKLHEGEYKINKCFFEFSKEYTKNLTSRAIFTTINGAYQETIINNQCDIPIEVLKEKGIVELGVYSYEIEEDKLKLRYSPSYTTFSVENGSYKEANQTEAPTPSEFEKYLYSFNENAVNKTNEFNENANRKITELNKISTDVSNMKVAVETSEQNTKTSEKNAKASEENAQNSAKKASESENNIVAIEKNINATKEQIDTIKTNIDGQVNIVNTLAKNASDQATKSENQAKISTENAAATSAEKNAVSEMKSEVEGFKNEAKTSRDEAESFKNETLEAKEVVEKSLENERIESEKRYAKAVDTEVITVDEFTQVELDEDGYMEDVSIEASKEITQEVREGYNLVDFSSKGGFENDVLTVSGSNSWGGSYFNITEIFKNNPNKNLYFSCESFDFSNSNNGNVMLLTYNEDGIRGYNALLNNAGVFKPAPIPADTSTITKAEIGVYYNNTETNGTTYTTTITKPMLAFEQNLPYEAYGVSPSLNYPSDFQNMVKEVSIQNNDFTNILSLPEGQFLGNFKGYSNAIDKGILKGQLKELVLTGNESIDINTNFSFGNIFYYEPDNCFSTTSRENSNIICNYLKGVTYNQLTSGIEGVTYNKDNNGKIIFFIEELKTATVEQFKSKLKELYNAGNPVKILYVAQTEEQQELSQENLQVINSLQTYQGENNVSVPEAVLSFKANQGIPSYVDKVVDEKIAEKIAENNLSEREISDSKYARALKKEVSETDFTQVFAENEKIDGLKLYGAELTQEKREGYNKLPITYDSESIPTHGITATYNKNTGLFKIVGTATEATWINIFPILKSGTGSGDAGESIDVNGKYLVSNYSKWDSASKIAVIFTDDTNTITQLNYAGLTYIKFNTETINRGWIYIPSVGTELNEEFWLMITDTYEQKPYEQYGAMPSLDYPSEVKLVEEQTLKATGKNILDRTHIISYTREASYVKNYDNFTVTTKNIGNSGFYIDLTKILNLVYEKFNKSKITISFEAKCDISTKLTYGIDGIETKIADINTEWKKISITHNSSNHTWLATVFYLQNIVTTFYIRNIQVEIGEVATEYETYKSTTSTITVDTFTGAIGDYKDTIKEVDGRWKVGKWIKEIVLNGTENFAATTNKEKTQVFELWFGYISENYFNATSKVLSNYFKYGLDGDVEKVASSSTSIYIAVNKETASTTEQFKAKLKELYDAGTPVKVYIVLATPDYIDLPDETQEILNGIKLRLGLNNFSIDVGTFSYIYNKSLEKELEEKDALIEELASRILALENATLNLAEGE